SWLCKKEKSPALLVGRSLGVTLAKGRCAYLPRHSNSGRGELVPPTRKEKPRSEATRVRGLFEHLRVPPKGTPAFKGGHQAAVPCRDVGILSVALKARTVCSNPDSMIRLSLQCPAPPLAWPPVRASVQ